jgi:hypothetical protein
MSGQAISQLVMLVAALVLAIATFSANHFGRLDAAKQRKAREASEAAVQAMLSKISDHTVELLARSTALPTDVWTEVAMKNVPPGVTDYLLLLFVANKGRISGKVRIKGSTNVSYFSTTSNSQIPVAVPNLWLPKEQHYKIPTILEFAVTEKTESDAELSIFTQGWIDMRGRESH